MALGDDEGRAKLRKAAGSRTGAVIRRCPNGETRRVEDPPSLRGGQPGELKHLSTRRKRKQ